MFIQTDKNRQYLYDLVETNDCRHKNTKTTEYPYSFSEMMKNSFVSVKTFAFRYRLNLAIERAEELGSCFISVGHKRRFCEGLSALGTIMSPTPKSTLKGVFVFLIHLFSFTISHFSNWFIT